MSREMIKWYQRKSLAHAINRIKLSNFISQTDEKFNDRIVKSG